MLFTGHVYVHGVGGNQQAVFLVGSDGNAQFTGDGGFLINVGSVNMPLTTINYVNPRLWSISGVPTDGKITVTLIGGYGT
jgi:hypothetical protein